MNHDSYEEFNALQVRCFDIFMFDMEYHRQQDLFRNEASLYTLLVSMLARMDQREYISS